MFREEVTKVVETARKKVDFLRSNLLGYFISAMLAGIYVGIGIILIFSIGGALNAANSPWTKTIMGAAFGIALSLVIFAGSELFTGNVFIMTVGLLRHSINWGDAGWLLLVCYGGNLAGSILTGTLFFLTGLSTGATGAFIAKTSALKMSLPFDNLFFRGVLCNILVCLAVWCTFRCKEEIARLVMIFWCLFAFITSGFEHSIANMTLLTIGLLAPEGAVVSVGGYAYNLAVVTLGNIVGAVLFLAIPYYLISMEKREV